MVAEQISVTWGVRFYWRWVLLLAVGEAVTLLGPQVNLVGAALEPARQPTFVLFCALACWIPAWMGADLLSIRTPANPEPFREWRPIEFLARAVGRLLPFLVAQAVWVSTFVARALQHDIVTAQQRDPLLTGAFIEIWSEFPAWFSPWIPAFSAASLAYAVWCGWLSGLARRPRQWLIAPLIVGGLPLVIGALAQSPHERVEFVLGLAWQPHQLALLSGYWTAVPAAMRLNEGLAAAAAALPWLDYRQSTSVPQWTWLIAACYLMLAVPPILGMWWVASRRHRDYPNTGVPPHTRMSKART